MAAILFPVFAKARAKARQTKCLSNLKQLGLAFGMYASDYDDLLPPFPPSEYNWTFGWWKSSAHRNAMGDTVARLEPYTKNLNIWFCDDDVRRSYAASHGGWGTSDDAMDGRVSYIFCTQWDTYGGTEDPMCPAPSAPTDVIRGRTSELNLMSDNCLYDDPAPYNEPPHNNGSNFLFMDGHVKWIAKGMWGELHPPMIPIEP